MAIADKVQAVADLRQPIKEDKSFYEGADMGAVIQAAMQGADVKGAFGELSDRFIAKHQKQFAPAVGMGRGIAKALHEG